MDKMEQFSKDIPKREIIKPVEIFPEKQETNQPESQEVGKPESQTIDLPAEKSENRVKMNNYRRYFGKEIDKSQYKKFTFDITKDHNLGVQRLQYKLFMIMGYKPTYTEIMKLLLDESMPKFEKILDKETSIAQE